MRMTVAHLLLPGLWLALPAAGAAREFPGLSQRGPTGLVLVPSAWVIKGSSYAVGLHRGTVKAGYGILGHAEAGFATPDLYDQPNGSAWKGQSTAFLKVGAEPFPDAWWAPGLAAGAENSVWNMAVPRPKREYGPEGREAETYYGAGTWDWLLSGWPVEATLGAGTGRFVGRAFGGIGVIPRTFFGSTLKFFGEYAGRAADFGARVALSRSLRLDFAMEMHADKVPDGKGEQRWLFTLARGMIGASQSGSATLESIFPPRKKPPAK